jgi:hypothetical protein
MKTWCRSGTWLVGIVVALVAGCSHKADTNTELEKAAQALGDGGTAQAPAPSAPPPPEPAAPEAQPVASDPTPQLTPSQEMRQAIVSYRSGQLEDAVTRLQKLRMTVALTPQQRMAIQDGVAALMSEVYGMAERGDARAIQAVKQYEQMQTTR